MHGRAFFAAAFTTALLAGGAVPAADVGRCSMVAEGRSDVLSFEAAMADGTAVRMDAVVNVPDGAGPFPAVVMLSGGHGLYAPYCYRAVVERFLERGIATFIVAGTTARDRQGNPRSQYSFADQVGYAFGAAVAVAELPRVDPDRVLLWGHSHGGLSAIVAASDERSKTNGPFRAVVAAAPQCPANTPPPIPLLILIGDRDLAVSVDACVDLAASLESIDGFEFLLMRNAGHAFWARGAPGYDEAAAIEAERRLGDFLARNL